MQSLEIVPAASALLQSLRGVGYSPETALADLVDNCIAAGARRIDLHLDWNKGAPKVEVLDDGAGMSFESLTQAMRFGGAGPRAQRGAEDLGRFGLGLKTASLSQCRRLTVASRRDGATSCIAWDVDQVEQTHSWAALVPETPPASDYAARLEAMAAGTLVIWENMDAIGGLFGLDTADFFTRVSDIRLHLAMVFHRFLSGDARRIVISVNGRALKGWDPFQRHHPATRILQSERRKTGGGFAVISPFVLPHRDRFDNEADYLEAGGIGGWGERQGFYVYRGKRLVVAGGWLGLGGSRAWTREEASRLARIAIDLDTEMDAAWRIDIRKSVARPPAEIRARLTLRAQACREMAREVFAWRGGGARKQPAAPADAIWTGDYVAGRARYRINRNHTVIKALGDALGSSRGQLAAALSLIERTVPVERIWLDVSESTEPPPEFSDDDLAQLAPELAAVITAMKDDATAAERLEKLLRPLRLDSPDLRAAVLALLEDPA